MRKHPWRATVVLLMAVTLTTCGPAREQQGTSVQTIATSPTPDPATEAYVAVIRAYWGDLHVADDAPDGSDVDAKACLGEISPKSPSDVKVVEPKICRAYAVATLAAHERFLAKLDANRAPAKFAADDQIFRTHLPKAISDVKALIAACDGPNRQAVIDAMWAYAHEMIPDVTGALDDVDPSVVHLEPHAS